MNLEFNQGLVRDLRSVMTAPGLLAASRPEIFTDPQCLSAVSAHAEDLEALEKDPSVLFEWIQARNGSPLLGRYFESLLGFWISRLWGARRFEQSIVVSRLKQTLGELDFVFEDRDGHPWHWEASVKFYLCAASNPEGGLRAESFVGAMLNDRLDKKLRKILGSQLETPRLPEALEALSAKGFDGTTIESRLFVKGALFYPFERDWRTHPHPPEISPRHLRGWWTRELPSGEAWVVLERRRWLSPFLGGIGYEPLSRAALLELARLQFADSRVPLMVAAVERDGAGEWRESHRGMLVHPGWPWRGPQGALVIRGD